MIKYLGKIDLWFANEKTSMFLVLKFNDYNELNKTVLFCSLM